MRRENGAARPRSGRFCNAAGVANRQALAFKHTPREAAIARSMMPYIVMFRSTAAHGRPHTAFRSTSQSQRLSGPGATAWCKDVQRHARN